MKREEMSELTTSMIQYVKDYGIKQVKEVAVPSYSAKETADILVISDWQAGHLTPSFNGSVLKSRVLKLCSELKYKQKQSNSKVLHIFLLGDMVHGERVGKTVNLDELELSVKEQIFDTVLPLLTTLIKTGLSAYKTVKVDCVRGNHGVLDKTYSLSTNLDDFIYYFIKDRFREEKRLTFSIAENFYKITTVLGHSVFITHGDSIKSAATKVPFNAITTRVQNWMSSAGKFDAAFLGHFHTYGSVDFNGITIFENGTVVTDDSWVLKVLGYTGSCCQLLVTVDKRGFSNCVIHKIGLQ